MFAAGLLPLLWSLGGCAPSKPLVLAGHPWPGYEPMFLGRTLGLMPPEVVLLETPTVQASIEAVRQGRADGAMLTLDEVLVLRSGSFPLEVVLVFDVSKGGDVLLARKDIKQLSSLKGKRVGAEDSALGTLMLAMVLEKAGLSMQDIHPVKVPYESHQTTWEADKLDAIVTYEPVAGRLRKAGATQLLSTRDLPDTVIDVLAVMPQVAKTHASALRDALHAHFEALAYIRQNPWDSAYRIAPRLGISAEELIDSLRGLELPDLVGNQRYLAENEGHLLTVANKLTDIMRQAGMISKAVNHQGLYSNTYLPRNVA